MRLGWLAVAGLAAGAVAAFGVALLLPRRRPVDLLADEAPGDEPGTAAPGAGGPGRQVDVTEGGTGESTGADAGIGVHTGRDTGTARLTTSRAR